jgi:hypothetical protein
MITIWLPMNNSSKQRCKARRASFCTKALFLAFRVYRYLAVVSLSLGLEACATDTTIILKLGILRPTLLCLPREQLMAAPAVSDA